MIRYLLLFVLCSTQIIAQNFYTFKSGGEMRNYYLYVPDDLPSNAPLVFVLHGYFGNAVGFTNRFHDLADDNKFVVCAPNGLVDNYGNTHWNANFSTGATTVDDFGFLTNLALFLQDEYDLNPDHTFSCGFSNGGYMSWSLAIHKPDVFKAVASVTGTMSGPDWIEQPNPELLVPIMQISGTLDENVPMDGSNPWPNFGGAPDIYTVMNYWKDLHSCDSTIVENAIYEYPTDITYYNSCATNSELRLYVANGMEHVWPDFAASEIWEFFMQTEIATWNCLEGACVESEDGSGMYDSFNECVMSCDNTSINDLSNNFEVYPNPSTGLFNMQINHTGKVDLSVYNVLGEVVVNKQVEANGVVNQPIELSNYSKGIYNLIMKTNQSYHSHKLLVQ